jgi:MFS family permease
MNEGAVDPTRRLRWGVYSLLIALAAGQMAGRLLAVNAVNRQELETSRVNQRVAAAEKQFRAAEISEDAVQAKLAAAKQLIEREERRQRPFLSGNDRSRWLAIRALAESGSFEIDAFMDANVWNTIDMVKHRGRDGEMHLYSSKPPLLIVLLAGEYWAINKVTGWTLADNPYEVGRLMLFTVQVLPTLLMLAIIAILAERFGRTDWGRIFVVAAAAFGTMLTPFVVVLNNHTIAAVSAAVALYAFVQIWFDESRQWRWFALAGLAAAFTAANELPALSFFALMAAAVLWKNWRLALAGFAPLALLVFAAALGTNYWAHDSWRPPYAHRSATDPEDNWYHYSYELGGKERQSYWLDPQGIDKGEPSKLDYAIHCFVGHHGIFSLTPVWLLSAWGAWLWLRGGATSERQLAAGIALLTVTVLTFYIGLRPQIDRNYGGMTSGLRWLFWLAPLWLWAMLPAADRVARSRRGMSVALMLLAFSALSASYPTWNPWIQPWIYNWLQSCGWRGFS